MRNVFLIAVAVVVAVGCVAGVSPRGAAAGDAKKRVHDVRFLAYNVCGLPDFITQNRGLIRPVKDRFLLIGDRVKNNYDVVAMQEVFVPDRYVLESKMRKFFVARGTDSQVADPTGSGVYIFSKGPIIRSVYERWERMHGPDAWSHKGFVGATTRVPGGPDVDVFSLHAQAGGDSETRIDNYRQMLEAIKRFSAGDGRPVIVMGDFNCEAGDEECIWLLKNSHLKDADPKSDGVDHVFYDDNGSGWKISVVSTRLVFDEKTDGRSLSDHLGLEAVLRFEK
jgi:endonuclease/exonuclease/phosphatase family metal-dependent hydrolase